jgi:hypothetical protein
MFTLDVNTDGILGSLSLWSKVYSQVPSVVNQTPEASDSFNQSSDLLVKFGRVMLEVPLTDLQDAIGKSGASKIFNAISNLSLWIKSSPQTVEAALESMKIIDFLTLTKRNRRIITFFICHITLWAFVGVADKTRKSDLISLIDRCEALNRTPISALLNDH